MLVSDVLAKLRVDIGDADGVVFTDAECLRALARAVTRVNLDLATGYVLGDTELAPDPTDEHLELLLLAAHALLAGMRRGTSAAKALSFQSGDKRVDKTRTVASWADLADSLWAQYRRLVCQLTGRIPDEDILTPQGLTPVIYERASLAEEEEV